MQQTAKEKATKMNPGVQQKTMTEATVRSLAPKSLNKALESLDTIFDQDQKSLRGTTTSEYFKGPFGVMQFSNEEPRKPTHCVPSPKVSPRDVVHSPPINEPDQPAYLLNYFKRYIRTMALAAQSHGDLCPWKAIHLPVAERTHKELKLGKETTCTEQALYFSLLAASCFHQRHDGMSSAIPQVDRGNRYKEMARQQLELGIQDEVMSHGQNSYEELLMGLLSGALLEV